MNQVRFQDNYLSSRKDNFLTASQTVGQPLFKIPQASKENRHLILIYDLDAPYPEENKNSPEVHYLVSNIESPNLEEADVIFSYAPFDPPFDSEAHRVYIDIYRQKVYLRPTYHRRRINFDLNKFVKSKELELAERFILQVENREGETIPPSATGNLPYKMVKELSVLSVSKYPRKLYKDIQKKIKRIHPLRGPI